MAASKLGDNAGFGVEPQGYGCRIDWQRGPQNYREATPSDRRFSQQPRKTLSLWRYRGRYRHYPLARLTQWLHRLVIGAAAAFRRNPGNITVRVFYVAGF